MRRLLLPLVMLALACRTGDKAMNNGAGGDTGEFDSIDADGDGFFADEDCDDSNAAVNQGATEVCDGVDNDCDGDIDEGVTGTWYSDDDGDSYGDATSPLEACAQPAGSVTSATDCDDSDPEVSPVASERCDGIDNDCDGEIDEDVRSTWYADGDGDGYGDPDAVLDDCDPPSGFTDDASDCDDTAPAVNPAAEEVCNNIDDDCDGTIDGPDATDASTWYNDGDGDGYGDLGSPIIACTQPSNAVADSTDCDDVVFEINPGATEVCNSIDDDCDLLVDDDDNSLDASAGGVWYADSDTDGYGDAGAAVAACSQPSGTVADNTDCDDGVTAINPAATEVCNRVDDDCDGDIDDDDASLDTSTRTTWYADSDTDGYGDLSSPSDACAQPSGSVADSTDCDDTAIAVNPGETEVCNTIDDDCDGDIDDDDASLDTSTRTTWYADSDTDGYGDLSRSTDACAQPAGSVADSTDCDDTVTAVNPGATEVCNTIDDDCDGDIDDDDSSLDTSTATTWYADSDSDGYGDATSGTDSCVQPTGTVTDNTDCDDTSASAYPDALERLTGTDTDCDGDVDEAAVAVVFAQQCLSQSGSDDYSAATMTADEEDALSDHLADLDLGLDRYDEPASGWGSTSLADYNLLLMSKCGWGWDSGNQAMVDELLDQRDAGAATFVFGDDMAWYADEVTDYEELLLMDNASTNGSPGPSTVTPASPGTHAILTGSYGTVSAFAYDRDMDETTTWGNGETVLATRGTTNRPVWVAFEDSNSGVRQASYLGSIDTCNHVRLSSTARSESEALFQNTVEWLLDL